MTRDEIETYLRAASIVLELPIARAYFSGVVTNFERLEGLAALVNAFPLEPDDEPAPRWEP